jgi:hypothetical protein
MATEVNPEPSLAPAGIASRRRRCGRGCALGLRAFVVTGELLKAIYRLRTGHRAEFILVNVPMPTDEAAPLRDPDQMTASRMCPHMNRFGILASV